LVKNLTPKQRIEVTIYSTLGGMVGLSLALISMIITLVYSFDLKILGFGMFVFFMIILQWVQYSNAKETKERITQIENDQTLHATLKGQMRNFENGS